MIDQFTEQSDLGPPIVWAIAPLLRERDGEPRPSVQAWLRDTETDLRHIPGAWWSSVSRMGAIEYGYWAPQANDTFLNLGYGAAACDGSYTAIGVFYATGQFIGHGPWLFECESDCRTACSSHFASRPNGASLANHLRVNGDCPR